ncbi:GNAT family N-acetyltransferase [uncultured Cohaesibacter sp.]|uniref:GNAT family N-acetyltransferase n=1 Tax=uncultured Cohaesibacter sp. TaxID=1002546 RepID=UPI00293182C7|nr:GNAT family N-acetyltransferase [uncultured Cohaesibacter sp.]
MIEIINCRDYAQGLEAAMRYIHGKWGAEGNFNSYLDCARNASPQTGSIPQFFLMLRDGAIIGCYGLVINGMISRHDLHPWFCCLFVEPDHRGNRYCVQMFDHARNQLAETPFSTLYLVTEHDALYERFGWTRIEDGFSMSGERMRLYKLAIHDAP